MNQTNLHYINCGNQFVNATGDGIDQVPKSLLRHERAMYLLGEKRAVLTARQKYAYMLQLMPACGGLVFWLSLRKQPHLTTKQHLVP